MVYLKAAFLAVVEGFTEFLPISSTGHLILVEEFIELSTDDAFNTAFMVIIQLPAIFAVVVYFWKDIWPFAAVGTKRRGVFLMWGKIALAVLPAVVLGTLFEDTLDRYFFAPIPVAVTLLLGGIVLIVIERYRHNVKYDSVAEFRWQTALWIGLFQCLAMIPGTSRSGATIIGAMLLGASRPAAAEFSFFLAIPTMLGATAYKLAEGGLSFSGEQWGLLGVGSVVSFAVAYVVIAGFMNYVQQRDFRIFGYYRIILAVIVFGFAWFGMV